MRRSVLPSSGRPVGPARPWWLSAVAVLALLAVSAGPVSAVDWGTEVRISDRENVRGEVLRTASARAVTIWQRGDTILQRRTTDGGTSWSATARLASDIISWGATSALGRVDLTYVRRVTSSTGNVAFRLFYRRSTDGGVTWSTPLALTSAASRIADTDVARRTTSHVAVAWTGLSTGNIYTRTSTDGGKTFGPTRFAAKSANSEPGRTVIYRGDVKLALGTGVMYLAYSSARDTVSMRRSTTGGSTWSAATVMTRNGSEDGSLVASGSSAAFAYTTTATGTMKAVVRRTTNKGSSWSGAVHLGAAPSGTFSTRPSLAYRDGVLAVVFKYGPPGASPVWHRQSSDFGATWGTRTQVSATNVDDSDPEPAGVAILDARHLAGYSENRGEGNEGLWVRRSD
jgi:hypothetical protein